MECIGPGTYRITSVASSTALTVPDNNEWDVVCWQRHKGRNQQWYLQRSGKGYRFKNCQYGHYLTVTDTKTNSLLRMGEYPTTWRVFKGGDDYNMYIIKDGDIDRVVDLDNGAQQDGTHLHTWDQGRWNPPKRWWFERLSDETGEEGDASRNELTEKKHQIAIKDQQLASKDQELVKKDQTIAEKERQLAELANQLANKDRELSRVQDALSKNAVLLEHTQSILRQAETSLSANEQARGRKVDQLESELLQQQKEIAGLRERTEKLESIFPQTANSGDKRSNNMT